MLSVFAQGSKIFAGSSGGLLVSIDGGATFATRNLGASFAGFVNSIIPSGERVYAATDKGVAVSADKGQTFAMRTTADGLGSISVRRLALAGSTLYAATGAGLSISTDGGTTFVNYTTGLVTWTATANDLSDVAPVVPFTNGHGRRRTWPSTSSSASGPRSARACSVSCWIVSIARVSGWQRP